MKKLFILYFLLLTIFSCNKKTEAESSREANDSVVIEKQRIERIVKKINETRMPIIYDSEFRATKMQYLKKENTIVTYYQISDSIRNQIVSQIDKAKEYTLSTIREDSVNAPFIAAKVTFKYIYLNAKGNKIISYKVTPNEYLK